MATRLPSLTRSACHLPPATATCVRTRALPPALPHARAPTPSRPPPVTTRWRPVLPCAPPPPVPRYHKKKAAYSWLDWVSYFIPCVGWLRYATPLPRPAPPLPPALTSPSSQLARVSHTPCPALPPPSPNLRSLAEGTTASVYTPTHPPIDTLLAVEHP